ncbi:hypothetical protein BDW22DRAFT_1129878 [Trametopsis cervina]|nr:hypothetical protein BDW22DRAFT_1129878 [Trametopsis cervina]
MEQTHELNGTKLRTYYGVKRGKEGTRIYDTWVEAKDNVQQIPDASILQLRSLAEAQQWLNSSQFGAFYSEEITEPALPNPSK